MIFKSDLNLRGGHLEASMLWHDAFAWLIGGAAIAERQRFCGARFKLTHYCNAHGLGVLKIRASLRSTPGASG